MHPRNNNSIDGEGLQADVMRFMAIIAFCLVAIMALVRDVSPPTVETTSVPETVPAPEVIPAPEAIPVPEVIPVPKAVPIPEVTLVPEPAPEPTPEPTPEPEQIVQVTPEPEPAVVEPVLLPVATSKPPPVPEQIEQIERTEQKEEGLSLRFGSDRDFLRLIAKGDVGVYLFDEHDAYRLGANYRFSQSQAPGELYELMPETIPSAIKNAASESQLGYLDYRWGVAMPARIAAKIRNLVADERSGQLVINRFGEVEHRPGKLAGG